MTGQVQSPVVFGGLDSLEEGQIEVVTGNGTSQLGGADLDFTAVGSHDGYRRSRARLHMHLEVDAFSLVSAEIGKSPVIRIKAPANHESRSWKCQAHIMPGSP